MRILDLIIEKGVPIAELRGRPTSDEYLALLLMEVGTSFTSRKTRGSLYHIAKNLRIPVKIRSAGDGEWRVWKIGERDMTDQAAAVLLKVRKTLITEDEEE